LGLISIDGCTQGFTERIDNADDVVRLFGCGFSHQHSVINKLAMQYGGMQSMQGKSFERAIIDGHLDGAAKAFCHNDKK